MLGIFCMSMRVRIVVRYTGRPRDIRRIVVESLMDNIFEEVARLEAKLDEVIAENQSLKEENAELKA